MVVIDHLDSATNRICFVQGCVRTVWSRGLCGTHYARMKHSPHGLMPEVPVRSEQSMPRCPVFQRACSYAYRRLGCRCDVCSDDNRNRCRRSMATYRNHHHNKVREAERKRYASDLEKGREKCRRWSREHPEVFRFKAKRRRALVRNANGFHTIEEWLSLVEFYNHHCAYCGKYSNKLTQDHIVPLSLGGTDYIDNILPACLSCNCRKGVKKAIYVNRPS